MKKLLIFSFLLVQTYLSHAQNQSYFPLSDSTGLKQTFIMGDKSFTEYYLIDKQQKGEYQYSVRVRQYSWGEADSSLFREGEKYYYSRDKETHLETIEMPKDPIVNESWLESDSSWRYEVKSINATLKTPTCKYENLIMIEAEQLTGRDKNNKYPKYYNYYARGKGYIASVVNGKLLSYLKE